MEVIKQNIILLTQTLLKGGAEKQITLLAKVLAHQFDMTVIVFYGNEIDVLLEKELVSNSNIGIIRLSGSKTSKIVQLYRYLKKNRNAILFNYLLLPNFLGGVLAKIVGIKASIGGIRSAVLKKNKFKLERFINNKINNYTIFNNKLGLQNCVENGFNKAKCIYIPNALYPIPTRLADKQFNKEFVILSVGRFEEVKNYPFSLAIISELIKRGLKLKYIIVGWGSKESEIRNRIKELNIIVTVDVVINPTNINDYYRNADIFLQTSEFEGLSNTIMEAMSFSLPIVATFVGDNESLVKHDFGGYVLKSNEVSLFANKIEYLYKNPEKRKEFGSNCHSRILSNYSLEKFKNRYIAFINNIVLNEK